jgi:predicted aspartyl protease
MSTPYSTDYNPPLPILQVTFGHGDGPPSVGPHEAVIDTGADATIVPEAIAQQLKAIPLNAGQLETQWGDIHPVTIYLLDIRINDQLLPNIVVAGDSEANEIVLGRNVLNKLALFLDGPQQKTEVLNAQITNRLRARRESLARR